MAELDKPWPSWTKFNELEKAQVLLHSVLTSCRHVWNITMSGLAAIPLTPLDQSQLSILEK
jgi:hypothetical protein